MAATRYRLVIEKWGATFGLLMQLGNALKDSQAYDEAERVYLRALELEPLDADSHLQMGHLMKLRGRLASSRDWYEKANTLDPQMSSAAAELSALSRPDLSISANASGVGGVADTWTRQRRMPRADLDRRANVVNAQIVNQLKWRRE